MPERTLNKNGQLRTTCDFCTQSKLRCDRGKPSCRRCLERNQSCIYSAARRRGRPLKTSASINTSREGLSLAGDIHQDSHQSPGCPIPLSESQYGQQQNSSSILNSGDPDSTMLSPDQEDTMSSNADPSYAAEYAIEFGSDFEFDIDNALSGNLVYSFPSFTLQEEAGEDIPTSLPTHEDPNLGQIRSLYSANFPLSMTCLASLDKPLGPESQAYKGQSSIGRADRFFLSSRMDVKSSLEEGSAFLEASSLINAVSNGNKSDQNTTAESYTRNGRLCCCTISLNTLQVLCFHPALSQLEGCPPLDFILLLEDYTNQLYTAVLRCSTCRSNSLHSLASLCICTDLIIEMLRRVIQNSLSYRENGGNSTVELGRPETGSSVCVGQTCLDDQLRQSCVRRLLRHRISRLAAVVDRVARLGYKGTGSLEEAFGIAIKGILCKTESLLGMMEA